MFVSLEADNIDSVVIAYSTPTATQDSSVRLEEIKHLWEVLESYVQNGKLSRIGISDVDTELFIALYNSAKVIYSYLIVKLTLGLFNG